MNNRIEKVRATMKAKRMAALIVTNQFNLIYLSGFHGLAGDGCMVITKQHAVLITDSRYETEMKVKLANTDIELVITRDYYQAAAEQLHENESPVGFEDSLDFATYQRLATLFGNRLQATNQLIETIRFVKDDAEIQTLTKSAELADESYAALLNYVHAGLSERDVERFLYDWLTSHGSSKPSFDTIVASGYRSALPHGGATNKLIQSGELVTVDYGFYYDDYTFDMTRTFAVGDPGAELKQAYAVVQEAQTRMIAAMHSAAIGKDVDAAARDFIKEQGYGEYFGHGSGHGIGLDIHEGPILGPNQTQQIYDGYVMTAEPGIYLPGKGGIRIEDDVLIKGTAYELLTHSNRELIIIK
ncbi:M24 family metallopeptidase [Nicoliella lavandulae]|uniref:Xaa-Pro peptidase family protein n=1 Tax=Nicoliella lavandulae TaxID=3082954 RepID=A0ABU8SIG9_9LACO